MTWEERAFIYRAWENKQVTETQLINDAMINAVSNVLGGMFTKNFKRVSMWDEETEERKIDREEVKRLMNIVLEIEETQGKDWIKRIRR